MKNLVIIEGCDERFVLIDKESDKTSLTAHYVPFSKYDDGFFEDEDIISIEILFVNQTMESVSGWEYPDFKDIKVHPGDSNFNYQIAEQEAIEVANEMILQHELAYV